MGYPPATVANVVPGNPGRRSTRPAATPAAVEPTTPPAAVEPTSTAPASSSALPNLDTGSAAGFLLGLVGTAVLINFMRAGVPGVKIWFGAKFLNITGAPASTTPAPRAGPGGTIQPGPSYTSPDGGKNFDPSAGAGSSGV